ncbi:hypothetical protein V8E54_011734 [Elaphomyces granulatus]|jgi:hypothetical protein
MRSRRSSLIDAYTIFAASVLAASSVLYMYNSLNIHWASSIPAFLALACVPFPFLSYRYGEAIRARCKFSAQSIAFMKKLQQKPRRWEIYVRPHPLEAVSAPVPTRANQA